MSRFNVFAFAKKQSKVKKAKKQMWLGMSFRIQMCNNGFRNVFFKSNSNIGI